MDEDPTLDQEARRLDSQAAERYLHTTYTITELVIALASVVAVALLLGLAIFAPWGR